MKKIIANVEYDTETAELLHKRTFGFIGDPEGYEECLFKTRDGRYFLYTNGGAESKYPSENIKRFSAQRAETWLKGTE